MFNYLRLADNIINNKNIDVIKPSVKSWKAFAEEIKLDKDSADNKFMLEFLQKRDKRKFQYDRCNTDFKIDHKTSLFKNIVGYSQKCGNRIFYKSDNEQFRDTVSDYNAFVAPEGFNIFFMDAADGKDWICHESEKELSIGHCW